ncbi:hypothetical protein F2Q70_00021605 [Brassica cretica]|uniref:Uncharacterized protein n=1 Tax=Brassica cretica TaxID=69181 RepID=A0A8S9GV71_BRACR|nr:hypothetical protein F2Q70_00021605 [Brassica cretica]
MILLWNLRLSRASCYDHILHPEVKLHVSVSNPESLLTSYNIALCPPEMDHSRCRLDVGQCRDCAGCLLLIRSGCHQALIGQLPCSRTVVGLVVLKIMGIHSEAQSFLDLDVFIEEGEPDLITTTEAEQHVVDGYEIDAETEQHIVLRDEIDHEEREIDGGELFMRYAILMVARLMLKNMMILMMVIMK